GGKWSVLEAASQPNILFILTDDQRFDSMGCAGNQIITTPNIDQLAKQGVRFENTFCTTSICAISRACFMLGQYERRHHINGFRTPYSKEQLANSFPILLRKNGYRTGIIGKWGIGGEQPKKEYDYWRGYPGQGRYFPKEKSGVAGEHLTQKLESQAIEFLDGCSTKKPFMLQLYTKAAHCQGHEKWQFQPDPKYNDLFKKTSIPLPKTATPQHFEALAPFLKTSEARLRWKIRFANEKMRQKSVKDYYRLIVGIDEMLGKLRAKLKEKGLDKNTIIIFTSDNGFYLGEHGLAGKWFMHEESLRLPLIIYNPLLNKKQQGSTTKRFALNIDVAPTILDLAGVNTPNVMQGKSLVPLMEGKTVVWRKDFLYEHRFAYKTIPQNEGVRGVRWKYVRYTTLSPIVEELYDLKNDPHEEKNLSSDKKYTTKLTEMRKRWRELVKENE
ncbi:Arylsulfatase, partial [hydrothermal vent metagenome]